MTLVVLALDALDAGLVGYFDIDAYRLETNGELETFAGKLEVPYTLEVWTTVATGLTVEEHGVTRAGTSSWSNPLLEQLSRVTALLSERHRTQLGDVVERLTGAEHSLGMTDAETVFDPPDRVVHNWPGVTDGTELQRVWNLLKQANDGDIRDREFRRRVFGIMAEQIGWAEEMPNHDVGIAAVHIHALDAFGHAYREDEARLQAAYEHAGELVGRLADSLDDDDELLLLSDHGMNTSFFDPDETPGEHSWRAYVATTVDTVPDSVFDVAEWIDANAHEGTVESERLSLPEGHLRDLGYLE